MFVFFGKLIPLSFACEKITYSWGFGVGNIKEIQGKRSGPNNEKSITCLYMIFE